MADSFRRRALVIGVSHYLSSVDQGPDASQYEQLPFAIPAARELANSLRPFGYDCRVEVDLSSGDIGEAVNEAIHSGGPNDLLVIAILGHSDPGPRGLDLYVLGSDERISSLASVDSWIRSVEDSQDGPMVLFLLDTHMGQPGGRLPWQAEGLRRTLVIAAGGPGELAFNGNLTKGTATVLRRFSAGDLSVDPVPEYIPVSVVAREVSREVGRRARQDGSGLSQRVTANVTSIAAPEESWPFFPNLAYRGRDDERDDQDSSGESKTAEAGLTVEPRLASEPLLTEPPVRPREEPVAAPAAPTVSYAELKADVADGDDQLSVSAEVDTLCNVIMAKDITPPLSIGLFGNWGTGKSFFMSLMRNRIERLAESSAQLRLEGTETQLCMDVCQIEFNAWHYIDTNLWASLASRIIDQLAAADGGPGLQQVMADLPSLRVRSRQLEDQRQKLQDRVGELRDEIPDVEPVGIKDLTLAALSKARDDVPKEIPGIVEDLLDKAGVDKDKVKEFDETLPEVGSVVGLALFLLRRGRRSVRFALLAALAVVIVVPPLAVGLLHSYVGSAAAWVSALVASVAVATVVAGPALNRAGNMLRVVNGLVKRVDEDRHKSATAQQLRIADLQRQIDDLDARIQAVRDANSVHAFALKRHGDDDYRREEGTLAIFRRDLEQMSSKLTSSAPGADLDRIVLYIDDLDRCPPARVVEVLQAIHLLLAFPLFVVVVGADPRWLLKSLHTHYRSILGTDEKAEGADAPADEDHWAATPQNYLEKIFQIPFCLRPMSSDGYSSLVTADIGPLAAVDADQASLDFGEADADVDPDQPGDAGRAGPPDTQADAGPLPGVLVRVYPGDAAIEAVAFTPAGATAQSILTSLNANGRVIRRDVRKGGDAILVEGAFAKFGSTLRLTSDGYVAETTASGKSAPGVPVARARIIDPATRQEVSAIDLQPGVDTAVARLLLSQTGQSVAAGQSGGYWTTSIATRTALDRDDRRPGKPLIVADSWHLASNANGFDWITDEVTVRLTAAVGSRFVTDPGERRLAAVESAGRIRVWAVDPQPVEIPLPDTLSTANAADVVCLGAGRLLAVATGASTRVWDLDAVRLHAQVEADITVAADATVTALALSSDDRRVAIGFSDGTVQYSLIAARTHAEELATEVMRLTEPEAASIRAMSGLIMTPRSARRLINIYRLLRTGLTADDLSRLQSRDHGAVVFLLAMLITFPQLAADLLVRLLTDSEPLPERFAQLLKSVQASAAASTRPADHATRRRFAQSATRVLAAGNVSDLTADYKYWAPPVARFSFRTMDLL